MKSVNEKIAALKKELTELESSHNEIMEILKEETVNYEGNDQLEIARRMMCFYFGEHINFDTVNNSDNIYYASKFVKKYSIHKGGKWENGGVFVSDNTIHIYADLKRTGFICHKTEFLNIFTERELSNVWIWYCKNGDFRGSYEEFANYFKGDNSIEMFRLYLDNQKNINDFCIKVIDEPSLKIEDMVLCIIRHK